MANGGEPGVQSPNVVPRWLKTLWDAHPLVVVAGVAIVALAVSVALIWPITDLIAAHDVGVITGPKRAVALQVAREAVRTQLLTLGAGVFAAGALIFTARNFSLSRGTLEETRRTVELSRGTLEETRRTVELTEKGQVADRYTKAIEQLGSDKLDVRIGGIYALERIARDSATDYHSTVMEVLAAFIRDHSREQWAAPAPGSAGAPPQTTRPDIQAAVTVIGRRVSSNDRPGAVIDLRGAKLSGADLVGAHLDGAKLMDADLADANLTGANLAGVNLYGANLTHAYLNGADLTHAYLNGTNLTRAILARAHLDGASLGGTKLKDANLTGAYLTGADLTGSFIFDPGTGFGDTEFIDTDLTGVVFDGGDFSGAMWPFDAPGPGGWMRDPDSGRLKRASDESGGAP